MAVWLVSEIPDNRRAMIDERGKRTYTRTFQVYSNSPEDGPGLIGSAIGIPRRGEFYITDTDIDLGARAMSVFPQATDDPFIWRVSVEYSSLTINLDLLPSAVNTFAPSDAANPANIKPPVISWSTNRFQKPFEEDVVTGDAVTNSALEKFDPPPMVDDCRLVLEIQKLQPTFDPTIIPGYQNTVNKDKFFGFDVGQVKCTGIHARDKIEDGIYCWDVTYSFEINTSPSAWAVVILDAGFRTSNGDGTYREITSDNGQPMSRPTLLDGNGQKLALGAVPFYGTFTAYPKTDFSKLNLP